MVGLTVTGMGNDVTDSLPMREAPQPAAPPVCSRCGHLGPAGPPGALRGHRPNVTTVTNPVVRALTCSVPGCGCTMEPTRAEWWTP